MDPQLWQLLAEGEGHDQVPVILRLRDASILPAAVRPVTQFGHIMTCRLRRDTIPVVRSDPAVLSMKASRLLEPGFDSLRGTLEEVSSPLLDWDDQRRPSGTAETARGVAIGVADWGCDVGHEDFRLPDGSTRLLALWDQRPAPNARSPQPFNYGTVHWTEEINQALLGRSPYRALGYHPGDADPGDDGAHGTHVLSIAAGNGRAGGPMGLAPEANLVFVHLSTPGTEGLATLGDSVTLLEAVDFIFRVSGTRPCAVNLSLGRHGGGHTGDSLVEQGLDAALATPSRAISMSCGNYHQGLTHACGRLRMGETRKLAWVTSPADRTPNELEVWYPGLDRLMFELFPPDSRDGFRASLGERIAVLVDGKEVGRIYHRANDPNSGDHHLDVFLGIDAPPGRWRVALTGEYIVDGRYHAWVERDPTCRSCQSRFAPEDADSTSTINTICNGVNTIATGAFDPRSRELAPFSSSGPTRNGRLKPDLVAPGVGILAARSTPRNADSPSNARIRKSGTSMASPHVTGTLALMFQAAPRPLSIEETRRLLLGSLTPPEQGESAARVGHGYLDSAAAIEAARHIAVLPRRPLRADFPPPVEESAGAKKMSVISEVDIQGIQRIGNPAEDSLDSDLSEAPSPKRNLVILSGGPGLFHPKDPEHDVGWSNYVDSVLLMSLEPGTRKIRQFWEADEQVHWLVYKPAYASRWADDKNKKRTSVADVGKAGFASYVDLLESRAYARGWKLHWVSDSTEVWKKLESFSNGSISRFWYYGHASGDLWLYLQHSADGTPVSPPDTAVLNASDILAHAGLRKRFQKQGNTYDPKKLHRFLGCNTSSFARTWAVTFGVWTEGASGTVEFGAVHKMGSRDPSPVGACVYERFSNAGTPHPVSERTLAEVLNRNLSAQIEVDAGEDTPKSLNAYVYIVGTDVAGGGDFNVMREWLQKQIQEDLPFVNITYDYKKGESDPNSSEIRKFWKRTESDVERETFPLGPGFATVWSDIEAMASNNQRIRHLHFLTHFQFDTVRYRPWRSGFTSDDGGTTLSHLKSVITSESDFRAAFSPDAVIKVHGCQLDRPLKDLIQEFCKSDTNRPRRAEILDAVRKRIENSFPFQLAALIGRPVWAAPVGAYTIYKCSYLPLDQRGKRFCVESKKDAEHTFQRTIRFYEANYNHLFARAAEEVVFDDTYHMKYKPELRSLATLTPVVCAANIPKRGSFLEQVPNQEESPAWADRTSQGERVKESLALAPMLDAARIYDSFLHQRMTERPSPFSDRFDVVGWPGEQFGDSVEAGDILLCRALGEFQLGQVAVITLPEVYNSHRHGLSEYSVHDCAPGAYFWVAEQGKQRRSARMVFDSRHRIPGDRMLVRLRPQSSNAKVEVP